MRQGAVNCHFRRDGPTVSETNKTKPQVAGKLYSYGIKRDSTKKTPTIAVNIVSNGAKNTTSYAGMIKRPVLIRPHKLIGGA